MDGPPLKRQRLDEIFDKKDAWDPAIPSSGDDIQLKYIREVDVGITEFLNREFEGFDCILKYKYSFACSEEIDDRYEDFVVNEVGLDGNVIELKSTNYEDREPRKDNSFKGHHTPKHGEVLSFWRCYSYFRLCLQPNQLLISRH